MATKLFIAIDVADEQDARDWIALHNLRSGSFCIGRTIAQGWRPIADVVRLSGKSVRFTVGGEPVGYASGLAGDEEIEHEPAVILEKEDSDEQ